MNAALITECLRALSDKLASREMLVSDAIISALKILRIMFTDDRLKKLNRELLGYLDEEVREFEGLWREAENGSLEGLARLGAPAYRMISGYWIPEILVRRGVTTISCCSSSRASIFCNLGAQELENLLGNLSADETTYFGIRTNKEDGSIFMCRSSQLFRLYSAVRKNVLECIDELVVVMSQT